MGPTLLVGFRATSLQLVGDKNSSVWRDRHLSLYPHCMSGVSQALMIGLMFQIFIYLYNPPFQHFMLMTCWPIK